MIDYFLWPIISKNKYFGKDFIVCYKNTIVILNEWRAVDGF